MTVELDWTKWGLRTILTTIIGISGTGLVSVIGLLWSLHQQVSDLGGQLHKQNQDISREIQGIKDEQYRQNAQIEYLKVSTLKWEDAKRLELLILNSIKSQKGNELMMAVAAYIKNESEMMEKKSKP